MFIVVSMLVRNYGRFSCVLVLLMYMWIGGVLDGEWVFGVVFCDGM